MLRGVDNFSTYGTGSGGRTNMLRNPQWLSVPSTATPQTNNPRGALGTHNLQCVASANNGPRLSLGGALTEFIIAQAIYIGSLPTDNDSQVIAEPHDSNNDEQCSLVISSTGTLQLKSGGSTGTLIAESEICIFAGTFHHIEVYFKIGNGSPAGGACEVRVDEVIQINESGLDTQATAVAGASQVMLWTPFTPDGVSMDVTDFAWVDLTGTDNNDFAGDCVVLRRDMTATDSSAWTRNTGASDHAAVDDPTPDDDTTYIAASAADSDVIFGFQSLPAGISEVVSVTVRALQRKVDAGSANVQASLLSVSSSPAAEDLGADVTQTLSYQYNDDHFGTDPATAVPITPASYPDLRVKHAKTV